MVFAGERYYCNYRIMLTAVGLWPYQKPSAFRTAFFFSAYSTFITFQFSVFLTAKCNFAFVIKVLSDTLPGIIYFLIYNCLYFNGKEIKQLLEQMKSDWNTVEDSEMKILVKYAKECRIFFLFAAFSFGSIMVCLVIIELLPIILDSVAPMNESRPRKIKLDFEMIFDEQQYFYIYLIYEIVLVAVFFSTMTVASLLLAFVRHCCAIYKIASTSIENIVTKHTLEIPADRRTHEMYRKIAYAVFMHRKAMWFTKFLLNALNKWFLVVLGVAVLSLSCNLLRFIISMTVIKELSESLVCVTVVGGHFVIMFIGNYIGQGIIDHSTEMFTASYNTAWYLAPLPIQKLLLFIMQYSLKTDTLMFGGVFIASLEGFSTLVTSSISYFTVLYSIK